MQSLQSLYSAFSPIFGVKFYKYLVVTQFGICGCTSGMQVSKAEESRQASSGVPRHFVSRAGGSTNSVEDRGQTERGSGGGSTLVRGSGGSCNLVQDV